MKYIYFDFNCVSAAWRAKAEAAKAEADAIADEKERQDYISGKSAIWSDLKASLENASDNKCWYTEARENVSYYEVDHYRPKKKYPWLAFSCDNFRLSGGKPNRKKKDDFPLRDEACRASCEADNCNAEEPLILDPLQYGDPDLLTFKADGEPVCAAPDVDLAVSRVSETIAAVGLDSAQLCEARREKWRLCERKIKKLRDLVVDKKQLGNAEAAEFSLELCQDIAGLFDDKAEFTATAKACALQLEATNIVALAREVVRRHLEQAA